MKRILLFALLGITSFGHAQSLQSILYQNWAVSHWQDWMKQDFTYNSDGGVTTYLYSVWDEATLSWKNSSQTLVLYNPSGQSEQYISQSWDADTQAWTNGSRSTYAYTAFGKVQTLVFDFWEDDHWTPYQQTNYNYDSNQFPDGEFRQIWDAGTATWIEDSMTMQTCDANGNLIWYQFEQWIGDALQPMQRVTQTFSPSNQILTSVTENYDNTDWKNESKTTYAYDANDYMVFSLFQNWADETNSWQDFFHHNYTNNPNGTISEFVSQQWLNPWTNFQRALYTYENLDVAENELGSFAFYPNPTTDALHLSMQEQTPVDVSIIDASGQTIRTQNTAPNAAIDLRELSSGVYVLLVRQNSKTQAKKFVKK